MYIELSYVLHLRNYLIPLDGRLNSKDDATDIIQSTDVCPFLFAFLCCYSRNLLTYSLLSMESVLRLHKPILCNKFLSALKYRV